MHISEPSRVKLQGIVIIRRVLNQTLRKFVVLTTNSVRESTTNAEALNIMLTDGVDAMIKTDNRNMPVGIVRRDIIVSRLMVKLAMN